MEFLLNWIATTLATMAAIYLVPGINAVGGNYLGPIMAALSLALVNALVKPVMQFFSLPLTVVTLGLFLLVINALMLMLAAWFSTNVIGAGIEIENFGSAFIGAIIISIVSALVGSVIGVSA
jgi:putative membrane protein